MLSSEKGKKKQDIQKLEEEISNFFEDLMYAWGGSPLLGRIYALCVLRTSDEPLLQKELAEAFNVNASTISRNLKDLAQWRLIDRRREPGTGRNRSREWKYYVSDTSFLGLLSYKFEESQLNLREKIDSLIRIRNHWGKTLSEDSKEAEEGKHALSLLERLTEWMEIVEKELNEFLQKLHQEYLDLERKYNQI
ncbi:MAG: GbsR/MarR family transcriptional regulator [Candidatus Hodarchaeota archaeon]